MAVYPRDGQEEVQVPVLREFFRRRSDRLCNPRK